MATPITLPLKKLSTLDRSKPHNFVVPAKKINEGHDVSDFLMSRAYRDIMIFILQLNRAMFPRSVSDTQSRQSSVLVFEMNSSLVHFSDTVLRLRELLSSLDEMVDEVPLDTGPRRFGNVSFRKWCELLEARSTALLQKHLHIEVQTFNSSADTNASSELKMYLLGSFGSSQRLDYGTGHELNFLAFLGGVWKLGGFQVSTCGDEERGIVLGVIEP